MPKIELLLIGHELLDGRVLNRNEQTISRFLHHRGLSVEKSITIGDHMSLMRACISASVAACDVLIITGGLGPTEDDKTRQAVAWSLKEELVKNLDAYNQIKAYYQQLNKDMPASNIQQTLFPKGAHMIGNAFGTAPGFSIVHKQCLIIVFPGVPKEMTKMLESEGIKRIEAHLKDIPKPPLIRTYKCFGEGESSLFEKIKDLYPLPESVEISFQSSVSEVIIKIKSEQDNKNDSAIFDALCQVIKEKLGSTLFVEGDETFIGMFSKQVAQSELTLGVAESCTGGLVSEMITDVPGASAFFTGAVVAYDNAVKQSLLTVPKTIIDTHGAVSAACAEAMAEGIRRTLGSDIGCSVTGIAGPTGASPDKPVGTVYFGYADKEQTCHHFMKCIGERDSIRQVAAYSLLRFVKSQMEKRTRL